jgi:Helix-turn-helix domain
VGGANGDRSAGRRKKRRGGRALSPGAAGEQLRTARERAGIDLAEVHDRTGISWRNLEALESGDTQRFSGSAATIAVRRYAELVSLDPDPLVKAFATPAYALAGSPAGETSWLTAPGAASSGHLRRYDPDHSHLRSFTQTAPVPTTPAAAGDPSAPGRQAPPARRRKKAPWPLRFFTWLALLLLLVGTAGLVVDKYKPQWLRDIHVLKLAASPPRSTRDSRSRSHLPSAKTAPAHPGPVTTTTTGFGSVDVKVAASTYTVVVTTSDLCWVKASTPLDVNPIVDKTLTAGQSVSVKMTSTVTQLTFELGSVAADFTVQIAGRTVRGWSLHPDSFPFYATFSSN